MHRKSSVLGLRDSCVRRPAVAAAEPAVAAGSPRPRKSSSCFIRSSSLSLLLRCDDEVDRNDERLQALLEPGRMLAGLRKCIWFVFVGVVVAVVRSAVEGPAVVVAVEAVEAVEDGKRPAKDEKYDE